MMRWYQRLFRRARPEKRLDAELRFHQEQQVADYVAVGMAPEEAQRRARLEFGGLEQVKEECRDVGAGRFVETLIQDVRYGLRQLRRNPGFTVVAVITLAMGIGATVAIFGVVNTVLLRSLPFNHPGRLVVIKMKHVRSGAVYPDVSFPDFEDWKAENRVFAGMAVYRDADGTFVANGAAIHVAGETVSANLFSLLGVRPLLGRAFLPSEDKPASGNFPIVLSYRLWQQYFSENDNILGQTVNLDGSAYVVVGVMPPNFQFPIQVGPIDFWRTVDQDNPSMMADRGDHYTEAIARLKPGVAVSKAQTDMSLIEHRLAGQYPKTDSDEDARLIPEMNELVGNIRPVLWVLLGAVGSLLLIACVNVATLLLARADARQKEIGVRLALGAGQLRVARQMLTESALLVAVGAGCGLLIACVAVGIWVRLGPKDIPRLTEAAIDGRVLLFTVAVSVAVGMVFGVVPGLSMSKVSLKSSLREGTTTSTESTGRRRARNGLAVVQVALALLLLVGAGLAMNSFIRLSHVKPGFDPNHVITMTIDGPGGLSHSRRAPFFNSLVARVRALPGVTSASAAFNLPLGGNDIEVGFTIQGRPESPGNLRVASIGVVAPGYFKTMKIRVLRGRSFSEHDLMDTMPVVIVNETLARRVFGNQDPLGQDIEPGLVVGSSEPPMRQIVGVVADVKSKNLRGAAGLQMYMPQAQLPFSTSMTVVIRTAVAPESIVGAVRSVVQRIDRALPIYDVRTMNQYVSDTVATLRFDTLLLGIFGGLALLIAAVGIYGVIAYSVTHRTHEIGIRIALGARRGDVLRLVLGQGMNLAVTGVAIGLLGALALTRFLSSLLYDVQPMDPLTLVTMSFILISVVLLACYIPARRAAKVDPMVALRHE
jgi:putative ABC transport system permease protein